MTERDKITEQKLKKAGIFDFKETYKFIHRWLTEENYDVEETKYQETIKGDAKDIEIEWNAKKKISDYFQNEIKVKYRILGMKGVEVDKDGDRVPMNQGSFELKIVGTLAKDYENTWENNSLMKFLRGVYDKYIVESTIKKYENKLIEDVEELLEQIKAFIVITGTKDSI